MYDHIQTLLQATLNARTQDQAKAHQGVVDAQTAVTNAQNALNTADSSLAAARNAALPAQSALNWAQSDQAAKQQAANSASAALAAWAQEEPDPFIGGDFLVAMLPPGGGGGKPRPNPAYAVWRRKYNVLKAASAGADDALAAANGNVANAQNALNVANNQVAVQQNAVVARTQELAAANSRVATASAAEQTALAAIAAAQAQVTALDQRAARLVAAPLDRPGVTAMAEEEQAEVSRLRALRAAARSSRYAATTNRSALLTAHDRAMAGLPNLSTDLHGWSDAAYSDPPNVGGMLDTLLATASGQAASTPRTDDIAGQVAQLQSAVSRLQTTVSAAARDRDAKYATLQTARATVAQVNEDQP